MQTVHHVCCLDELMQHTEWQNVSQAEGDKLNRSFKKNALKFYMKQRSGEFLRSIPLQIECVKEMVVNEEIIYEDIINDIFMRTMENSIARLCLILKLHSLFSYSNSN